jgi:hypothetical protein
MPKATRGSRRRRIRRGGGAAENMLRIVGTGDQQYDNVFRQGTPGQSNVIRPLSSGGSRRRKRGGLWGQVINQAIVPASILGLQQTYRRKKSGGKKTRKYRR